MSGHDYEEGNLGHRPPPKGGYFPVPPVDGASDLRAEMTEVLAEMGVDAEKHHHEVAPSQHELGMRFSSLLEAADDVQNLQVCGQECSPPIRKNCNLYAQACLRR